MGQMAANGRLSRVPWSKRGAWPNQHKAAAYKELVEPAPGAPALVREEITDGKVTGYYLNIEAYPDKARAYSVLGIG
jgi:hypothetical protein